MFYEVKHMTDDLVDLYAIGDPFLDPDTGMIVSLHDICPDVSKCHVEDVEEGFKTMIAQPHCTSLELVAGVYRRMDYADTDQTWN